MKWQNKGNEFDKIGNFFKDHQQIMYIGNKGGSSGFEERIKFLNVDIDTIDINIKNIYTIILLNYFSPKKGFLVVGNSYKWLYHCLTRSGIYKKNTSIFLEDEFLKEFLPIYSLYCSNKVYNPYFTSVVLTTMCTLNCKYCLNYQPYIINKKHFDYKRIIKDIDIFFNKFDRVEYFSLTGGEPLLYSKLNDLIEYINVNYKNKIGHLWFATNGTIIPSDELCLTLKKTWTEVILDDYTSYSPELTTNYNKVLEKLQRFDLNYKIGKPVFFKSFPPAIDYTKLNDNELIEKYDRCKKDFPGFDLEDGKIYACNYSSYAATADLVESQDSDYLELSNCNNNELVEFIMGYTERGYAEFCKYCNCFFAKYGGGLDENGVTQQPKNKLLSWDITNPTQKPIEVDR